MSTLQLDRSYAEEIRQIAELVFTTMLDLPLIPVGDDTSASDPFLTSAIYFAGSWRGAVLIECVERDACVIAQRLMRIPLPTRIDEDVRDSLSELVNMIGGNLKPVLPHGVALSMPSVIEGRQYALRHSARVVTRETFQFGTGPVFMTLLEMPEV